MTRTVREKQRTPWRFVCSCISETGACDMKRYRQTILASVAALAAFAGIARAQSTLLNVSYDPTRELYAQVNAAFSKQWEAQSKQRVRVQQSHGGSGAQARAV